MTSNYLFKGINLLILVDCILVLYFLLANVSLELINYIVLFDVVTCIILLFDLFRKMNNTDNKILFLKANMLYVVAIIPFELVFSMYFISFRLLLLFKLFRLTNVVEKYFNNLHRFLENTKLDKILGWIVFTVIIFTFALYILDPSLNLFDSLWFVVVTLTTVGYGDVTPNTFIAKIKSLFLLVMGIFVFSTLSGAISSYFTDKILNIDSDTEEGVNILNQKIDMMDIELKEIRKELALSREENKNLHDKLDEILKK